MEKFIGKDNPADFIFHSLCLSSATTAADSEATVTQLINFFGWKSVSLPQEYVSSSKVSVKSMATKLQGNSTVDNNVSLLGEQDSTRGLPPKAEKIVYIQNFSRIMNH